MKARLGWLVFLVGTFGLGVHAAPGQPAPRLLTNAFAHNDYAHPRPLLDALDHGFCAVEADIHLVDGKLLVAHDLEHVSTNRTLEALYLDPLRERVRKNGGAVYRDGPELTLLIDIKSEAEATYAALRTVLQSYAEMLTVFRTDATETKAVTVIVSGNRPQATLASEPVRYASIDGRLPDLPLNVSRHLVPLISDNWTKHFQWRGTGALPAEERDRLKRFVAQAHQQGRRVRFWAVPNTPEVWGELQQAGVDLLNTDDLVGLQEFLLGKASPTTGGAAPQPHWEFIAPHFSPPAAFAGDFGSYKSPLQFYDGRPVRKPSDWPRRREEILQKWHKLMGPWPALIDQPRIEYLESKRRENFTQHKVRLEIARKQTGEAYLLVPDGQGPFPAVVIPYYEPETSVGLGQALRDFGYQLAKRGFVTLSIGSPGSDARQPDTGQAQCQPLSFLASVAANGYNALATLPEVDARRVGIVGHSYGGKWAMFASCLYDKFACAAWSDGGIVWDESRPNVNFWERWYLGQEPERRRAPGVPNTENPRTGAYRQLVEAGHDLHELHALMAPRPFLVSGGSEDPPLRWQALNHAVAVNSFLGHSNRVAMTHRKDHTPTPESNEQIYRFFEHFLKPPGPRAAGP